ncbi:MAG: hypothetical protein U9O95_05575 [Candidatus Marinimicrobia bacterium]|nr:hypothetical protein [Candidatus Neomarinimicrobiota bacterium]
MRFRTLYLLLIFILVASCFEPVSENGTLRFRAAMNEDLAKYTSNDTCLVQDLIWKFASFEVSTGSIISGAYDTLEWIGVYSDTSESRLTEFEFEAELSPGTYKSLRLAMRNRNWWIVELGDSLCEIVDYNREGDFEATPYSYYNFAGCWYCDQDTFDFQDGSENESVSNIVVNNGDIIDIVMNWNLYQLVLDDSLNILGWIVRAGHDMIEWDVSQ